MERLKKLLRVAMLPCLVALMFGLFTVQADAATITYNLSDITSSNSVTSAKDGVAYSTVLTASTDYKLPSTILIISGETVLGEADYSYSPTSGNLSIRAESVKGDITIMGAAVKLKSIDPPVVKGNFVVYETLTAEVTPSDATVTYQWKRDNKVISGATSPTYTLTLDDIGHEINVQITGTGDFGGQKISTSNTVVGKKAQLPPSQSDVIITNATENGKNNGKITSNSNRSMEYYDTVTTTWKALPAKTKPAGEYQVRFAETVDSMPSESLMVRIYEPCTSPVPTDVTITHLTVAGASTGKLVSNTMKWLEYYNGTTWTSLPASGLCAGKYQVRFAESTDYLASAPTNFFVMEPTTLVITPPDVTVTHVTVKGGATGGLKSALTNGATMEVLVDGVWKTLPQRTMKAGTYQVRYAETETTFPSAACNVIIKEPADAPTGIKVSDVSVHGGNTGAITGLKTTWQVSYDGKVWNDCTQTSLTGLSAGVYYFRTKETETNLASEAVKITVRQPEVTPEAIIDYVNGTLKNLTSNAEYLIDNVVYKAKSNGTISILENDLAGRSIGIKRKGNGTTTLDSAKQTVNIPARPDKPDAPIVNKKTDTLIEVATKEGLEYSINGTTWMTVSESSYTFKSLRANTEYTVYARVKAVDGKSFSSTNAGTNVTTKKGSSAAVKPTKIETEKITDTSITIAVVSGQEYSLNNGAWVRPTDAKYTWTDLKQTTRYTIQTRTAETADTMPSSALTSYVTTYTKHVLGPVTVDLFKMAIVDLPEGEYSINGGQAIEVSEDGLLNVEDYFGRTIQLRRVGSVETKTVDSDPRPVDVISPIAAPTAEQVNMASIRPTLTGFIVVEPDSRLEYQILDLDGFPVSKWKSSDGADITFDGLAHSTAYLIQVCFKPTETEPKSNAYISEPIYTMFYEDTPQAVAQPSTGSLKGLIPNAAYLVNGVAYTASAQGTVAVRDEWMDSEITVVKCGDGVKTVDSLPQSLLLPGRVQTSLAPVTYPVTYYDGNNGAIGSVNADMEYSADGGKTWIAVTGEKIEALTVGEYFVRYRASADELFAGESRTVSVTLDTAVADHKKQAIAELENAYNEREASERYNDAQLEQIRAILDAGIENINTAMSTKDAVDTAKETVLDNMAQVPCSNTATADGQLVGSDITSDTLLQYPNDSDEVWGNVANEEGLAPALIFVIEKLGKSDTEALRDQFRIAAEQGTVVSADAAITADALKNLLHNTEVKLGLDITLNRDATPIDQFKGSYTVTILLPKELQGINSLNIISVGADGTIAYHPATVTGNYLSFETDHFSIYGVIGQDTLAIAKADTLQKITDLSEKMDSERYTHDNWAKVEKAFVDAIGMVNTAKTEQEVTDAWSNLLTTLDQIAMKRSLGWLWLLMLLVVLLIALIIVCYLVWHVHYFDGEEQIHKKFHFWCTKVALWTAEKEGFVLEGWYYDPELTDRAENEFKMPWHSVKLYAKWNLIEILSTLEEEPLAEEPVEDETATEATDVVEQDADEEISENEETNEAAESDDTETLALDAPTEETKAEEEYLSEAEEDVTEDDLAELALLDAPAEESEDETALLEAADEEGVALLAAPDEDADENAEEDAALLEAPEDAVDMLEAPAQDETPMLEAADEDGVPMLEAPDEDGVPLLEAPAETEDRTAVVVVGDLVEDTDVTEDASPEEDSYKDSDSYQAWLLFGDGEDTPNTDEDEKLDDGDEVQLFVNEKTGEKYHIRFNLSFRAKMTSISDEAKGFYRELKDEFLTYKGVKTRISWKAEGVRKGRETIARFAVRERTLCVFLALDPDAYRDSKYVFESVKDIKAYEAVPMLIRVKSDLSCRKVKELIADIMEPREVKRLENTPETDYSYLDEDSSTEARLRAGQLRIWAEGPDDQVCANRAAAATLHYLISPEASAEEAETLISDDMLDALMPPMPDILIVPEHIGEVSVEQLCKHFYVGDVIDIASMKEKGLLDPEVSYVKITSDGEMTKRLTVSAHMFERTAAKMILLTGGDIEIINE